MVGRGRAHRMAGVCDVMVKTGARSTPTGWECDYDAQTKVVMIGRDKADTFHGKGASVDATKVAEITIQVDYSMIFDGVDTQVVHARLHGDSDNQSVEGSSDFSDVAISARGESRNPDTASRGGQSPDVRSLCDTFKMKGDDRADKTRELRSHIDVEKYVVYKSDARNQVTARWGNRENQTHGEIQGSCEGCSANTSFQNNVRRPDVGNIQSRGD